VDGRLREVEPEAVALERQPAPARHDDAVRRLELVPELEEDALEGSAVRGDAVEKNVIPGAARGRSAARRTLTIEVAATRAIARCERLVRRRKDDVVEEEDAGGRTAAAPRRGR
jgi:hypothetical protein